MLGVIAIIWKNLLTNFGLALKEQKNKRIIRPNVTTEPSSICYEKKIWLQHWIKSYVTQNWSCIRHWPYQNVQPHTPYAAFAKQTIFGQNIIPGLLALRH
jgi:hypothetical protein